MEILCLVVVVLNCEECKIQNVVKSSTYDIFFKKKNGNIRRLGTLLKLRVCFFFYFCEKTCNANANINQ